MKSYTIEEMVMSGAGNERNLRKSHCYCCNKELKRGEGFMFFVPSRGRRVLCEEHYSDNGLLWYHGNAEERESHPETVVGAERSMSLTNTLVGIEFETVKADSVSSFNTVRQILEQSFLVKAESDCTVDAEFPTEKLRGLNSLSKVLQSMEVHHMLKHVNSNRCGAHIHANCIDVPYMRRYYHSIFIPLCEYIDAMGGDNRIAVFGSDWRGWAQKINEHSYAEEHSNFVNTQHSNTLEFRLPRIIGAKQYMRVVKFWREAVYELNNFDFQKTADIRTRQLVASQAGEMLVRIARKYFEKTI